eukprot:TRINITY_DN9833_c0_g1_i3.p1 TRINITY_DN9833_c0_g1~~TRINITY_DN9833_c0_g1_i3.p1  ORF type:complete len:205 (-),score=19.48 TRINITY_DN9833_c0_g1_i3:289-903(-)
MHARDFVGPQASQHRVAEGSGRWRRRGSGAIGPSVQGERGFMGKGDRGREASNEFSSGAPASSSTALPDAANVDLECTIFLSGLPVRCREGEVLNTLEQLGFGADAVASLGMPIRPSRPGKQHHNRGYCFVHFHTPQHAELFLRRAQNGLRIASRSSDKVVTVERAHGAGRHRRAQHQQAMHSIEEAPVDHQDPGTNQGTWLRL